MVYVFEMLIVSSRHARISQTRNPSRDIGKVCIIKGVSEVM